MRPFLNRHLFLMIGILSLSLWYLGAEFGAGGSVLRGPLFLLIFPMYIAWLAVTAVFAIAGPFVPSGLIGAIVSIINFAAGLAPYALADYVRRRRRVEAARQSMLDLK